MIESLSILNSEFELAVSYTKLSSNANIICYVSEDKISELSLLFAFYYFIKYSKFFCSNFIGILDSFRVNLTKLLKKLF